MFSLTLGRRTSPSSPAVGKESAAMIAIPAADFAARSHANPLPYMSSLVRSAYEDMISASSALNPMQPMMIGADPVQPDLAAARQFGRSSVASVDAALGFRQVVSSKVASALDSARNEALEGIHWLEAKTMVPVDYPRVVGPRFDASANWLSIAGELLALEGGHPFRPFSS